MMFQIWRSLGLKAAFLASISDPNMFSQNMLLHDIDLFEPLAAVFAIERGVMVNIFHMSK